MSSNITRRAVLKSAGGVATSAAVGASVSGMTVAETTADFEIAVHYSGRPDSIVYDDDLEAAIDDLDSQLPDIGLNLTIEESVEDDIDTDRTAKTVRSIERTLASRNTLRAYDVHLVVFTGAPGASEMNGAGFNVWRARESSTSFSSELAEDIDGPFPRRNPSPHGTYPPDGQRPGRSEGEYAFAFVNDYYIMNGLANFLPFVAELDLVTEDEDFFKNTVIHETCHCFGADHDDGTIFENGLRIPFSDYASGRVPRWLVVDSHYEVSPMCTWYVEDFMREADDAGYVDQRIYNFDELCDVDAHNETRHTQRISECTKRSIESHVERHVVCAESTPIGVEISGPRNVDVGTSELYVTNAFSQCGETYEWQLRGPDSSEISEVLFGRGAEVHFGAPGEHTLKVIARSTGGTDVERISILAESSQKSGLVASASASVEDGGGDGRFESRVTLDGSETVSTDATITQYSWTIYRQSPDGTSNVQTATREGRTVTWDGTWNRGGYLAELTVEDDAGRSDTARTTFTFPEVDLDGPTASARASVDDGGGTGTRESRAHLDASDSEPGDADIVDYTWTIYRKSPDGTSETQTAKVSGETSTWDETHNRGGYRAEVTVEDETGRTDTASTSFVFPAVEIEGPTASASTSVDAGGGAGTYESQVHLDASSSSAGDAGIKRYDWTIYRKSPDGTSETATGTVTGKTATWDGTHNRGGYRAEIEVEDGNGRTDTASSTFLFPDVDDGGSGGGSGGSDGGSGGDTGGGSSSGSGSGGSGGTTETDTPDTCTGDTCLVP